MKPQTLKLKSILLDNIYGYETTKTLINDEWYYKCPCNFKRSLRTRLAWCLEILRGKAIAVHYKEDEV